MNPNLSKPAHAHAMTNGGLSGVDAPAGTVNGADAADGDSGFPDGRLNALDLRPDGSDVVRSMPECRRISLLPTVINGAAKRRNQRRVFKSDGAAPSREPRAPRRTRAGNWRIAAQRRRAALGVIVLLQTTIASWSLAKTFPYQWLNALEIATVGTFAVLFAWISFGFWISMVGLWVEWRRRRRFTIDDSTEPPYDHQPLRSRTAILMPICNEDVTRVFAGIETTYRSLSAAGQPRSFDVYILSDSSDPNRQIDEELAWASLCRRVHGFGRIFYRHRRNNIKRKSGNIADFLRRWGCDYDFMVVFDADSVMTGGALVRLAQIMERHPEIGILQTVPALVRGESLFARLQQFASRVYGPVLAAGAGFLQLGESYYWGHNAILRVDVFREHCILPRLNGEPPFGGEILSHDFVEAALMGRAGFEVWIVENLAGSYEEMPPSLADELKRDRRWCQGNLQHLRLMFDRRIRAGHRAIFLMGIMTYASALFWFVFLVLSSVWTAVNALMPRIYFSSQPALFPMWPQWRPEWAIGLFSATALLLFLPKLLSVALILRRRETHLFGGLGALCASVLLEIVLSAVLAPVRMWFHAKFVVLTLLGRDIKWGAQSRADNETGWLQATRLHGSSTVFAFVWFVTIAWIEPGFAWWLLPVAGPLMASIPLSVYSSRVRLGWRLRRAGLLLTPEELDPPEVVKSLRERLARARAQLPTASGFIRLLIDGSANALHVALLRAKRSGSAASRTRYRVLREKALINGPESLTAKEKIRLIRDPESIAALRQDFASRYSVALTTAPAVRASRWTSGRWRRQPRTKPGSGGGIWQKPYDPDRAKPQL